MLAIQEELRAVENHRAHSPIKPNEETEELKVEINTFVWTHAPRSMSLGDADDLALALYSLFGQLHEGKTLKEIAERK